MAPRYALWAFLADWLTDHPAVIIGAFILIALVLASRFLNRGRRGRAHLGLRTPRRLQLGTISRSVRFNP